MKNNCDWAKPNSKAEREIYILNEADYQYFINWDRQSDPKLVKLFKSQSPWNAQAIADV